MRLIVVRLSQEKSGQSVTKNIRGSDLTREIDNIWAQILKYTFLLRIFEKDANY
jgi:hypothetical protein